jgi:benzoyl-CoA reductase subunit C
MEDKLNDLLSTGNRIYRTGWAHEWHKQGKKVIGVLDTLVPEEVIFAAGMLPWRIQGTWQDNISLAMMYRVPQSCCFLNHVTQSLLEGEFDFLDGMIASTRDADFVRVWDLWTSLNKTPFTHILDVPIIDSGSARHRFADNIRAMISTLSGFFKVDIDDPSLRHAIAVYDKSRTLLRQVYDLRKQEIPPLSGSEFLSLTTAAAVMPRDEFNRQLEELLPYIKERKVYAGSTLPRILLSSDLLDNPGYADLVEQAGCLIAMDDMDTGSRYFRDEIGEVSNDPAYALATHYLNNRSARMVDWQDQAEHLIQCVKEFNIDGVLDLPDMYDYPREFRRAYIEEKLKKEAIPFMSFERDYHLANTGQLKTRIEAFLEILDSHS